MCLCKAMCGLESFRPGEAFWKYPKQEEMMSFTRLSLTFSAMEFCVILDQLWVSFKNHILKTLGNRDPLPREGLPIEDP